MAQIARSSSAMTDASPWRRIVRRVKSARFRRDIVWTVMALPALIWLIIFRYIPMVGLVLAFVDYRATDGILGSKWVGFKNFRIVFSTDQAWRAARNTVLLNAMFIAVGIALAVVLAALLYEVYTSKLTKYYQTVMLLPHFMSWVIVGYFVFALLRPSNGVVNNLLARIGMEPINWYAEPRYWPIVLLLAYLWKHLGYSSLIYLAGMLAISPELYEAAQIDGANKVQQFFRITLPLISPLIIITFLLALSRIFNADFGLFFQVTRNSTRLYDITDVLDTYIYRALINSLNVSYAAAAGFYQSVVGLVLVVSANLFVRRIDPSQSLF